MKHLKTFENIWDDDQPENKDELIAFIKKHVVPEDVVALQGGFRKLDDPNENDECIPYSSYRIGNHIYDEKIVMLNKKGVLIQTYSNGFYMEDIKPYKLKYEDLDLKNLQKIKDVILLGKHISF